MAKQNLPMLVAQHADKAGYLLTSALTLAFVVLMIGGPETGGMPIDQFQQRVNELRNRITHDNEAAAQPQANAQRLREMLPVRIGGEPKPLPPELVVAPYPGLNLTVDFEGIKGNPARDLVVIEAAYSQIKLEWRPSEHSDTRYYNVTVWEIDEGATRPPQLTSTVSSGPGLYRVPQITNLEESGAVVSFTIERVTNNKRYGIHVRSVDRRYEPVSYQGNPEPYNVEQNEGAAALGVEGLYVEATPAGQQLGVPAPLNPTVHAASLAGVRLAWGRPMADATQYVAMDKVRVQLWRWFADDPDNKTLLTPITPEKPDGWTLTELNGQYTDLSLAPMREIVYAIRFYHVEAFPPLNRMDRARRTAVSLSANKQFDRRSGSESDEIITVAYRGEVITIDYPQRNANGDPQPDRASGLPVILRDETYVYASPLIQFDTSQLEENRVYLANRPLIEVQSMVANDERAPQFGSVNFRITKYFQVRDPETREMVWERFGATFRAENRRSGIPQIGEPRRPETVGPQGERLDEYQNGRWRNVGELDFTTTLTIIGFYEIQYTAGYNLRYVEFYDMQDERWPFKVFPEMELRRNRDLADFQAANNVGRTSNQMLELYSLYKAEIEYPARRAVVAVTDSARFVLSEQAARVRDWMYEWEYAPRVQAATGEMGGAAQVPPMWEFSRRHGLRFYPESYLRQSSVYRENLDKDPDVDGNNYTSWHNEVRHLVKWAHRELRNRWSALEATINDEVTEAVTEFAMTPGFDEVAVPALLRYIDRHAEQDVVIECANLVLEVLRVTHQARVPRMEVAGLEQVQEIMPQLQRLSDELYGAE